MSDSNRWNDRMLCPKCRQHWTHLTGVKAYFRVEDAAEGFVVEASHTGASANTHGSMQGCPSRRRDGVTLTFECENCQVPELLHITQHKGETFFFWENNYAHLRFNDGQLG